MNSPVPGSDNPAARNAGILPFTLYDAPDIDGLDLRFDESLMRTAAKQGPAACIWQACQGLVVPRTYLRSAAFDDVCDAFGRRGWPVSVRHSGGGVVPQGPGILNISLAYAIEGPPLDHSDAAYQLLCDLLSTTTSRFDIQAHAQAVEGSFCDGRFNLAVNAGANARKIAGTAQLWRRLPGADGALAQVVLVHGLLLVACDVGVATAQANALEQALGNERRYLPERAASLHELTPHAIADTATWVEDVRAALLDNVSGLRTPPALITP